MAGPRCHRSGNTAERPASRDLGRIGLSRDSDGGMAKSDGDRITPRNAYLGRPGKSAGGTGAVVAVVMRNAWSDDGQGQGKI